VFVLSTFSGLFESKAGAPYSRLTLGVLLCSLMNIKQCWKCANDKHTHFSGSTSKTHIKVLYCWQLLIAPLTLSLSTLRPNEIYHIEAVRSENLPSCPQRYLSFPIWFQWNNAFSFSLMLRDAWLDILIRSISEIKKFNIDISCDKVDLNSVLGVNQQFQLIPTGDGGVSVLKIFIFIANIKYSELPHWSQALY